ncbi:hypothetical protein AGMMS49991_05920 [Spirochaetia bacterium]|nr:hypothetical protein AGMMS49991_05920 [Spirochaetia bacterium]
MLRKKNFMLIMIVGCLSSMIITAQEALVSDTEHYYDFLALQGLTTRSYLNYRTLSDSEWTIAEDAEHPWQGLNLGGKKRRLFGDVTMRIYGPELFMSFNTAAPYGQNDGALWQGRGFNTSLTGGIRFTGYGVELTFKPQLSFSQNWAFEYTTPNYSNTNPDYTGKAGVYGYYGIGGIDAPQRFGDQPFFTWDWGDSEVRYTWKTLTVGFGTEPIWLGPAQLNPILHSNNAPSYPKLDIGLRRQRITIPKVNWYLGDIETRAWWGYLSESNYFDNNSDNNHNLITGFTIAYSFPGVLKGLSIGLNRIMLSKWDEMDAAAIFTLLWPFMDTSAGNDRNDQRASVVIDYLLPIAGLDIYLEWARNDFSPTLDHVIRYPFHTAGYTFGIKKTIPIRKMIKGEILLELSSLESSRDYYDRATTFYAHHIISQGHTNGGQWLGAGMGTGGNSQYLGFKVYFSRGYGQIFLQRQNPDLDYAWYIDMNKDYSSLPGDKSNYVVEWNIRAFFDVGISGHYFITPNLAVSASLIFRDEHNPLNLSPGATNPDIWDISTHQFDFTAFAGVKYLF